MGFTDDLASTIGFAAIDAFGVADSPEAVDRWFKQAWPAAGMTYVRDYEQVGVGGPLKGRIYIYQGKQYGYLIGILDPNSAALVGISGSAGAVLNLVILP